MEEKNMQSQIDQINHKLDLVLQYVDQQRLKTQEIEDLVKDVSIVGNDMFKATVNELDNKSVELDTEQLLMLVTKLVKNVGNLNQVVSMFESMNDLMKDLGPVFTSISFDVISKIGEFEQKGYLEFLKESGKILDSIVSHYSVDDIRKLAGNVTLILDLMKNMTQPQVLEPINNAVKVFGSMSMDDTPSYSLFKVMREMNKPEMKKGLGFMVTLMKNIAIQNNQKS
jgi:uncharacterized protein YjgD (DUF1641 family)